MTSLREDRCETCKWWQKHEYGDKDGSCHIRSTSRSFPNRHGSDWCGEHEPAEQGGDWPPGENDCWSPLLTAVSNKEWEAAQNLKPYSVQKNSGDTVKRYGRTQKIASEALDGIWYFIYEGDASEGFTGKLPIAAFKEHADAIAFVKLQKQGFSAVLPHPDAIPQWRKRPTLPGLYVCYPAVNGSKTNLDAVYVDATDIASGAPHRCEWCYGPIEKPKDGPQKEPETR